MIQGLRWYLGTLQYNSAGQWCDVAVVNMPDGVAEKLVAAEEEIARLKQRLAEFVATPSA